MRLQEADFGLAECVLRYDVLMTAQAETYCALFHTGRIKPVRLGRHHRQRLETLHRLGLLGRVGVRYRPKTLVPQLDAGPLSWQAVVGE